MNRRDFLLFRPAAHGRIAELSCERLYMRCLDAQLVSGAGSDAADASSGEPPPVFEPRTTEQVFGDLERDLREADVLRVLDPEWIASDDLKRQLAGLIESFRASGRRVEVSSSTPVPGTL